MARVLVVEDDADLRLLLASALKCEGHAALLAGSGRSGLELARTVDPELMLLDLGLPDLPGTAILEAVKTDATTRRIPVMILSGRTAESDRVRGLELGAEDYVTKPFSMKELLLRTRIILRRNGHDTTPPPELVECRSIRMDMKSRRVFVQGQELQLTPIEFRLLATLTSRAGLVQSREALLADVWGSVPDLETRTVDAHVKRLREKLGQAADCLETVRGVGYRFRTDGSVVAKTVSSDPPPLAADDVAAGGRGS
jgi:two-component system phosphate regulon response regulator PhoB